MVGLVLVSHSRALATAVQQLVTSMSGSNLPIAIAAGTGPERAELGTDATEILERHQLSNERRRRARVARYWKRHPKC